MASRTIRAAKRALEGAANAGEVVATKKEPRRVVEKENTLDKQKDSTKNKPPAAKRSRKVMTGETEEEKKLRETIGAQVLEAASGSKKMLGMHASAAGTLSRAIYDAMSIGCRSFALFVRNGRRWESPPMTAETAEEWKKAMKETGYPVEQILPHGSYLLNPGSADEEKRKKSRDTMLDECLRAEELGITLYNFHPGSTTGDCSAEQCIQNIADSMKFVLERTDQICLVVETMAGQGNTVGGTFEELKQLLDLLPPERVGVCIDTCHIFAAGYDIRSRSAYEKTMAEFGEVVGFDRLKALHLNDSKGDLGSRVDRHEHIGKGKIGIDAFRFIMNDNRFDGIPMVLETPEGDYANEMLTLYGLEEKK